MEIKNNRTSSTIHCTIATCSENSKRMSKMKTNEIVMEGNPKEHTHTHRERDTDTLDVKIRAELL